jgi:hypothetical protein
MPALLAKEFQHFREPIWFPKEWLRAETREHRRNPLFAMRAGQNYTQVGPEPFGFTKNLRARETRQRNVQEHGGQIFCMLP